VTVDVWNPVLLRLPIGTTRFRVKVDSDNAAVEGDEDDNVTSGIVTVHPYGVWLPQHCRQ
jgi:subtilase family serine protease